MARFLRGTFGSQHFPSGERELLAVLNVSRTQIGPPSYVIAAATAVTPVVVVGVALAFCILRALAHSKVLSSDEAPKIVLTSDFKLQNAENQVGPVKTMYDWAKGVGAKVEKSQGGVDDLREKQSKEDRIRAKRQAAIVDQVLGAIRENMTNLRISAATVFREFDADQSGVLSYWEFTKGLERLGVKLSDNRMELVMRSLDDDGNGEIELSEFENALEINK